MNGRGGMEYEEKVDGVGQAWLSNRGLENGLGDGLEGHSMIPALPTISSGFPILNFTGGGGVRLTIVPACRTWFGNPSISI